MDDSNQAPSKEPLQNVSLLFKTGGKQMKMKKADS